MEIYIYLIIAFLSLSTTTITSIVGFADKLALITILTLFIDIKIAIVITAIYSLIVYILRILFFYNHLNIKQALHMLIYLIPGILLGLITFKRLDEIGMLKIVFSILLLAFVLYKLFLEKRLSFKLSEFGLGIGIFTFGLVEASIGAAGPLLAVFLMQYGKRKEDFVVLAAVILLASSLVRIAGYAYYGLINFSNLHLMILLTITAIIGTYIGKRLMEKLHTKLSEYLVLVVLFLIAIKEFLPH